MKKPINFNASNIKTPLSFEDKNNSKLQMGYMLQNETYNMQQSNNNECQIYNNKLKYKYIVDCLDLNKREEISKNGLYYHELLMELKTKKKAENKLVYPDICKNKDSEIMFMLNKPDSTLSGKRLLNAKGYENFLCFSTYPEMQMLLVISWNYNEHVIYFPYGN